MVDADAVADERLSAFPNPGPKRNSPMAAPMASFSARRHMLTLIIDWAARRPRWVKCTTYTDAAVGLEQRVDGLVERGVAVLVVEGTGRVALRTAAVVRPVCALSSLSNRRVSPSVADISTNCAWGSVSSGTCQAQPRSGSA